MYLFNAKIENPEKLEQMLVGREQIVDLLVNAQLQHSDGGFPPQYLVIGPRGSGKTHMLRVVYDRLSKSEKYMAGHEIAYMVEDETGIGSYFDLLQRIFEALKRWSNDEAKTRFIVEQVENLKEMHSRDWTKTSENILLSFLKDKSLLVLIENFDTIMRGMDKKDEVIELAKLRDFIQQHQQVSFIATSQSLIHALSDVQNPFYGFFNVINLKRLTLEESFEFVRKIALSENDGDLVEFLESHEGKGHLEAIHQFTKGNHRLLLVFFDFLRAEFRSNLSDVFLKSIDELKPYYDSFIKSLAPQQQKIVQYLSLQRIPQKGTDIGRNCFLDKSTVSKQLSELQRLGYINPVNEKGRDKFYEVSEPLLRMCFEINEDRNGIIKLFVDFLGQLYASEQLKEKYLQYNYMDRFQPENIRKQYQAEAGIYKMVKSQYLKDWNLSEEDEKRLASCCKPEEAEGLINELAHPKTDILLYNTIQDYIEHRKWDELVAFLDGQLIIKPNDDYLLFCYGYANCAIEQYEKAIEAYLKSIDIDSNSDEAWYNLGNAYHMIGNYEKAIEAFQKSIEIKPNDSAWYNLGYTFIKIKEYQQAIDAFQKSIEIKPDKNEAWNNLGNAFGEIGEYQKAIDAYQRSIKMDVFNDTAWHNLGYTYSINGEYHKAVEAFQKAIEIHPDYDNAWCHLGNVYANMKEYQMSIEAYHKAIKIKPDNDIAWNNLGSAYIEIREYHQAIEAYLHSININPNKEITWFNLGNANYEIGEYYKAKEAFQKAVEIKDDDYDNWYNLGITLRTLNDFTEAKSAFCNSLKNTKIIDNEAITNAYSRLLEINIVLNEFEEAKSLIEKMFISPEQFDYISELKDSILLLIRENNETELKEIFGRLLKLCVDNNKVDKFSALLSTVIFELLKTSAEIEPYRWEMLKQVFEDLFSGKPELTYPLRYLDIGIRYYVKDEKEAIYELSREEREVFEKFTKQPSSVDDNQP